MTTDFLKKEDGNCAAAEFQTSKGTYFHFTHLLSHLENYIKWIVISLTHT